MMESVGEFEYNKKDLIGHGAFAVVFKGRNKKRPDVTVAIKSITKKNLGKSQSLLSKEIKILKELSDLHDKNVVALLDCKETTHHVYLVMEYCNGGDLADYLQAKGTLSEDTISVFLRQIAGAMKALNAKGIVHRDLKPQNILLCQGLKQNPPPSEIRLKIADFGFARFLQDGVMAATLCGSPMYMAPEVIMSLQYDAKADLWSIGTIVFQCLTGKAPFQAQTPQQLKQFYEKHIELTPNIPQGTSSELGDLLLKLLKRNAKDRIGFENFFEHPFLKPQLSAMASSPVAVPCQTERFSPESPALRPVTASPLSGNMGYLSRSPLAKQESSVVDPQEDADYLKIGPEEENSRSTSPTEDFVMVPAALQDEQLEESDQTGKESSDQFDSDEPQETVGNVNIQPSTGSATYKKEAQTSPTRPTTLLVQTPTTSPTSEPIPVPTQIKAYQQIMSNSPTSPTTNRDKEFTSDKEESTQGIKHHSSETRLSSGPDIGSLSPPTVQFTIGTPPGTQWRRGSSGTPPPYRHSTTPPSATGSPLRRSGTSPARLSPQPFTGPASLPTILGSPTRCFDLRCSENFHPFIPCRPRTVPDNMTTYTCTREHPAVSPPRGCRGCVHGQSDLPLHCQVPGSSVLSQQLIRTPYVSPHVYGYSPQLPATMVPYGGTWQGRERAYSVGHERDCSEVFLRRATAHLAYPDTSPPASLMFAHSPTNMDANIPFEAPELAEDTLMDDHHKEIMAKLSFVLDLVDCIIHIAQAHGTPFNTFSNSLTMYQSECLSSERGQRIMETQKRLNQLLLYVRSLQLLTSALQLAKDEINASRLHPLSSLKSIVTKMNERYHRCLEMCKQLRRHGPLQHATQLSQLMVAPVDKLIYLHALELFRTGLIDEILKKMEESYRHYSTAHILLHSLAQQAKDNTDKRVLTNYKSKVETRLFSLQTKGDLYPVEMFS